MKRPSTDRLSPSTVRVDVDETGVNKVRVGQNAFVAADAYNNQKFWGRVVWTGEQFGPKNVRTDEPTQRVDRKILRSDLKCQSHMPPMC